MAWDTEATRKKLLDAGARQFAAHGFSGARMNAIGEDAGVNKERVYQYFGSKTGLYSAVLADRLDRLFDGANIEGTGPEAVGAYAGKLFDRFQNDPIPARILAWESLELDAPAATPERSNLCAQRISAMQRALPSLGQEQAAQLLLSVVTLTAGWWTLKHLAHIILHGHLSDSQRRAQLVIQATQLAQATQLS